MGYPLGLDGKAEGDASRTQAEDQHGRGIQGDDEGEHGVCLGGLGAVTDEGAPEGQHLGVRAGAQ